ncbi:MAG: hypothetical protein ACT4TC_15925 [Myxococcaceae bacterium]
MSSPRYPCALDDDSACVLAEVLWIVTHYGPSGLAMQFPELSDNLVQELASWGREVQMETGGRSGTLALSRLLQNGAWVLASVRGGTTHLREQNRR